MGRRSGFDASYVRLAERWARKGRTRAEIAELLGISRDTMWRWESAYPEFSDALKPACAQADNAVESSLFERARGARTTRQVVVVLKHGYRETYREEAQVVTLAEEQPPDTGACIFWLKNRRREAWRDKIEHDVTADVMYQFDDPTQRPDGYGRKPPQPTAH